MNYTGLQIYNPVRDTRVYVTQNQDPNSRRNFTPTFVRQNQLVYGNGSDNIFNGLSPFRNFQCSSLVYYTRYVKDVLKGPEGRYNFILVPGTVPQRYIPTPDRGGIFTSRQRMYKILIWKPIISSPILLFFIRNLFPERKFISMGNLQTGSCCLN